MSIYVRGAAGTPYYLDVEQNGTSTATETGSAAAVNSNTIDVNSPFGEISEANGTVTYPQRKQTWSGVSSGATYYFPDFPGVPYSRIFHLGPQVHIWSNNGGGSGAVVDAHTYYRMDVSAHLRSGTPPIATIAGPTRVSVGEPVTLESLSYDADNGPPPDPGKGILAHSWTAEGARPFNANTATAELTWDEPGEYKVTLTVIDDEGMRATTEQLVTVGSSVKIDINGTPDQTDDITLYNEGSYAQSIPALITNEGGAGTFELEVAPAGAATLSTPKFELAAGASKTITITPRDNSIAVNDVKIIAKSNGAEVASEDMTIVSVEIPEHIRADNTPVGMRDRIPPNVFTFFYAEVTPNLGSSGQFIEFAVAGRGLLNGTVEINGHTASSDQITNSGPLSLKGITQTEPGFGGRLKLTVEVRGEPTVQSEGFSVAAIPINFHQADVERLPGGILFFTYAWTSDSLDPKDLNEVWMGEHITYSDNGFHTHYLDADDRIVGRRPWMANHSPIGINPFTWGPTAEVTVDVHRPPGEQLPLGGPSDSYVTFQHYGFHDRRTDPRPDDGSLAWRFLLAPTILIERFVENIGMDKGAEWQYRITKSGVTNTAPLHGHRPPDAGNGGSQESGAAASATQLWMDSANSLNSLRASPTQTDVLFAGPLEAITDEDDDLPQVEPAAFRESTRKGYPQLPLAWRPVADRPARFTLDRDLLASIPASGIGAQALADESGK